MGGGYLSDRLRTLKPINKENDITKVIKAFLYTTYGYSDSRKEWTLIIISDLTGVDFASEYGCDSNYEEAEVITKYANLDIIQEEYELSDADLSKILSLLKVFKRDWNKLYNYVYNFVKRILDEFPTLNNAFESIIDYNAINQMIDKISIDVENYNSYISPLIDRTK